MFLQRYSLGDVQLGKGSFSTVRSAPLINTHTFHKPLSTKVNPTVFYIIL